jgi:hypothetical protein
MADPRPSRRPSKAKLGRIKVLAVVFAGAAFVGSLAGVSLANPGTKTTANVSSIADATAGPVPTLARPAQQSSSNLEAPQAPSQLQPPSRPQRLRARPMTRSRGS